MKRIISVLLVVTVMLSYAIVYAECVGKILSEELVRFHIIASSNSTEDQNIKLDVRDYVSAGLAECEIEPSTQEYRKECERLAKERLNELGIPYSASASFEKVYIPKKSYKNITLPSGRYNAIRLVLGKGEGENWWCVAYPPLCFAEEVAGELSDKGAKKLKDSVPSDIYDMITDKTEYRFYIVDLIGKLAENIL